MQHDIRRLAVTRDSGGIVGVLSYDELLDGLAVEMNDLARVVRDARNRETTETGVRQDTNA